MRQITSVTALLFVLSVGLSAQSTTEQETVSKSDLKGVTDQMRAELRRLDKKAVERDAVMKEEARRQNEELVRKNAEAQEKLRAEILKTEEDRKRVETQRERKRTNLIYGVTGVGLLIALVCGVMLARRPAKTVDVRVVQNHQKHVDGILDNPESKDDVISYSVRNNNINPVPFILRLPQQGASFNCKAHLREGLDPMVEFPDGKQTPWRNRRVEGKKQYDSANKVN